MLRISVTTLEAFRLYLTTGEDSIWELTYENLIKQISKSEPPNYKMKLGTAYHAIIEDPVKCFDEKNYISGEFAFDPLVVFPAIKYLQRHSNLTHEIKFVKRYDLSEPVTLVGKIDALWGSEIHEHKTTEKGDYDKYYQSYQWRYYLDLLPDSNKVKYNLFLFEIQRKEEEPLFIGYPDSVRYVSYNMFRYPNLHEDCINLMQQFINFIHNNNLEKYFYASSSSNSSS